MSDILKIDDNKNAQSIEVLLCQYSECWSDVRQYDNLIWQIPSLTTIIVGAIVALSSTAMIFLRIILFIVALSLNIVMTIAFYKHQFFRVHRFREIEKIEKTFRDLGYPVIADGARSTQKIKNQIGDGTLLNMPCGWFYNRIAYEWLRTYMHLLTIFLVLSLIAVVICEYTWLFNF